MVFRTFVNFCFKYSSFVSMSSTRANCSSVSSLLKIITLISFFTICGFNFVFQVGTCVLRAARTSYRLLLLNSEIFSKLWDWSCFLDLVKQSSTCDPSRGFGNEDSVIADIRWCGIQILSVVLKMSCRPTVDFSMEAEAAFTCLLRLVLLTSLSKTLFVKLKF